LNVIIGAEPQRPGPTLWLRPDMRTALAARDTTRIYRALRTIGYSQQTIAAFVGQSQPEVSTIVNGRKVMAYDVLLRMAEGLSAPLCLAGMGRCCGCCGHRFPYVDLSPRS
jgi:predicted XRE-type DNA-binding protein